MVYKIADQNFQNDHTFEVVESGQYLQHHGIKGQKWGVRRFQNKDGSLTAAGKKRLGIGDNDEDRSLNRVGAFRFGKKKKGGSSTASSTSSGSGSGSGSSSGSSSSTTSTSSTPSGSGSGTPKPKDDPVKGYQAAQNVASSASSISRSMANVATRSADTARQQAKARINLENVTDDELRARINRLNMERQYRDLATETVGVGQRNTAAMLQTFGDVLAVGASAASILVAINQLKKKD